MYDIPDDMVPDPVIRKEFSINEMTLWRWDHDPRINFPPKIKIGQRNYRSRKAVEEFKAGLVRKAIRNQDILYKRTA